MCPVFVTDDGISRLEIQGSPISRLENKKKGKKEKKIAFRPNKTKIINHKEQKEDAVSVDRTRDLQIFSLTLSQLSYPRFVFKGWMISIWCLFRLLEDLRHTRPLQLLPTEIDLFEHSYHMTQQKQIIQPSRNFKIEREAWIGCKMVAVWKIQTWDRPGVAMQRTFWCWIS